METPMSFTISIFSFSFKSYYVVWKLFSVPRKHIHDRLFKSYYVVWKRSAIYCFHKLSTGLNRTMQYGNFFVFFVGVMPSFGLNRTMQYGNAFERKKKEEYIGFKSYYVVWKRKYQSHNGSSFFCLNRTMQYGNYHNFFTT